MNPPLGASLEKRMARKAVWGSCKPKKLTKKRK